MKRVNFDNLPTFWRGLLFLVPLAALYLMYSRAKSRRIRMTTINKTGKEVYFLLLEHGISLQLARFITAQAAHETGNFASSIYLENNNLFGMKLPAVRKTLATGENKGHAVFKTITDCIKDFQIYLANYKYLSSYTSIETYVEALKRNRYFEADKNEYINGVTHFYNLYFGN